MDPLLSRQIEAIKRRTFLGRSARLGSVRALVVARPVTLETSAVAEDGSAPKPVDHWPARSSRFIFLKELSA